MLFTPQNNVSYRLWTDRRCALVLSSAIVLFFLFVHICFTLIDVRPSIKATFADAGNAASFLPEDKSGERAFRIHGVNSADAIRVLKADGTAIVFPINDVDLNQIREQGNAFFILLKPRSLWQFFHERWQLMWSSDT